MGATYKLAGLDRSVPADNWRKRIRSVTLAWYAAVMGTSGLVFLLASLPYSGRYCIVIAQIVFIFDFSLFIAISLCQIYRFACCPRLLLDVWLHPVESNFLAVVFLAIATLSSNIVLIGVRDTGFWLLKTTLVLWFFYVGCQLLVVIGVPALMFTVQRRPVSSFTPPWILPPLGVVFSGAFAYQIIAKGLPTYESLYLIVFSYILIGLGFFSGLSYNVIFVVRMLNEGFPLAQAPTFFIAVGPLAWMAEGLLGLGTAAATVFPAQGVMSTNAGEIFMSASTLLALIIYGFSWLFVGTGVLIFAAAAWKREIKPSISVWSVTFPLAGHVATTLQLSHTFQSSFFAVFGTVLFFIWLLGWFYALGTTVYGLYTGAIATEETSEGQPAMGFQSAEWTKVADDDDEKLPNTQDV